MNRTAKRALSLTLSLLLLLSAIPMHLTASADAPLAGDVNLDGKVGSDDARLALRASVRLESLRDDALRAADADHDDDVTSADARLILRASVGLETLAPMPTTQAVVYQAKGFSATKLTFPGDKAETLGTLKTSGLTLEVSPGSLTKGTKVSATPLTKAQFDAIPVAGKFERILFPMDITCEGCDGAFFDDGVKLTMPLLEGEYDENTPYDRFVFCHYDEKTREILYLFPDEIDEQAHTMTVSLPHFSLWWGGKLTREEQIELFLDRYCTQLAVRQSERQKAAAELEPYLNAKAKALELTATAAKDLVEGAVNYMGGQFVFDKPGSEQAGDLISLGTNYTTGMLRAYYDKDAEKMKDSLSGAANTAIQKVWEELEFSQRAGDVFKQEYVKEFVPGAIDKLISGFGTLGTLLGCISGDDPDGAIAALGDILCDVSPEAALATKAVGFVATALHTSFTFWKSNQIEALYHAYKNGGEYGFGNEIVARNRQSFLTFLNCSSGLTLAKGVNRFYKMDKIGEICNKYGWSFKTYAELPPRYREIFEQRAENGLMTYFETRLAQEDAAEKLKGPMRAAVKTMMYEDLGALKRTNFRSFFHDNTATYDVENRLERLVRVKAFIAPYVDETKLERNHFLNWGDLLNTWISFASSLPKSEALAKFVDRLKELKLLKDGMDKVYKRSAVRQFFGVWVGEHTENGHNALTGKYDVPCRYRHTYTIGFDLKGRLTIRHQQELIEMNGSPYADPHPRDDTVRLNEKDYTVNGSLLTVPSKDVTGGYLYKFKAGITSYHTYWRWDNDADDSVTYEISVICKKTAEISGKALQ